MQPVAQPTEPEEPANARHRVRDNVVQQEPEASKTAGHHQVVRLRLVVTRPTSRGGFVPSKSVGSKW